jgi:UrcA family protein
MLRTACFALGALLVATSAGSPARSEPTGRVHTLVVGSPDVGPGVRQPTHIRVSTAGVDFHDRASAAAFHERLRIVAHRACDSGMTDLGVTLDDRRCARIALNRAVNDVDEPLLFEVAGMPSHVVIAENAR